MKISEFCFKAFATAVVIVISLSIAGWIGLYGVWTIVSAIAILGGIVGVIGIISAIWEKNN